MDMRTQTRHVAQQTLLNSVNYVERMQNKLDTEQVKIVTSRQQLYMKIHQLTRYTMAVWSS